MNKYLFMVLLILIAMPIVHAVTYESGTETLIYNITKCDGPVVINIKPVNPIVSGDLIVKSCYKKSNLLWNCNCINNKAIIIQTKESVNNVFNLNIEYYTKYFKVNKTDNMTPTLEEIKLDSNKRMKDIYNVYIKPKKKQSIPFKLDINSKNAIFVAISLSILLVGFLIFKFRKSNDNFNNDDTMNYSVTDKELDELLNKIK